MQRKYRCALACTVVVPIMSVSEAATIHVDLSATGNNDGTTWEHAYNDPQTAIHDAIADAVSNDEIWVAAGTYVPSLPTGASATFHLDTASVIMYGGFDGTEDDYYERRIFANVTILSGDEGSVYHVVTIDASVRLDGFTVTEGWASEAGDRSGGGIHIEGGSDVTAAVINCTVEINMAGNLLDTAGRGAGMSLEGQGTKASLVNCIFRGNLAFGTDATFLTGSRGGAVYVAGPANGSQLLEVRNCLFHGNGVASVDGSVQSPSRGGAFYATLRDEHHEQHVRGQLGRRRARRGRGRHSCEWR